LFFQSVQDLSIGGRFGGAQYQYTLQAENIADLNHWAPILQERMKALPGIYDVNTDQQVRGLESNLVIDRDTASRLGVGMADIDNTLSDAFSQRQVSNIYKGLNQYHVVLEVSDKYTQGPRRSAPDLRSDQFRRRRSAQFLRALRTFEHFALGQSPGPLSFHYTFL
jgi:multidrug efflux pump